jgi:tetratricopeptide (TPR) repeat protein
MKNKNKHAVGPSSQETPGEGNIRHLLAITFLGLSVFLAYSVSLHGTWALDDSAIGQFASIDRVLNLRLGYRKVAYLSFLINRWINPADPLNYRILNILIHIVNSVLVYVIALVTLRLPGWKEKYGRHSFPVALVSASVFALHPININAVAYIVQRMASLSAMFVLLALLAYIFARTSQGRGRAAVLYVVTLVCIFLGIFSKENAVAAVPLLLLYDYVFLRRFAAKEMPKKQYRFVIGVFLLAAAGIFLKFYHTVFGITGILLRMNQPIPHTGWTAFDVYWTPLQHILTEFRVVGRYLFLMLVPLPRFLVFDWWGFPLSTGLTEPITTLVAVSVIIGMISLAWYARRKMPFLFFGILWYFLALSLESFVAVGADLYYEHRNYLPAAGLIFGACAQLMAACKGEAMTQRRVAVVVLLLSAALGFLTFERNLVWKDSETLWKDTVDKAPGNVRALVALGNAYLKKPDFAAARDYFEKAVRISAADGRRQFFQQAIYSLGMTDLFLGDQDKAKEAIGLMAEKTDRIYSYRVSILSGFYKYRYGDVDDAIRLLRKATRKTRGLDGMVALTILGDAYRKKGQPESAIECYSKAVHFDPSFSAAYYGMGVAYLSMRDLTEAAVNLKKTLTLDPNNPLALSDMSDVMLMEKEPAEEAMRYAQRAVANASLFYQPYLAMGNVLIVMGKEGEAEDYYQKARERGLKDFMVPFSKARAYVIKGDGGKAAAFLEEVASMKDAPESLKKAAEESLKAK